MRRVAAREPAHVTEVLLVIDATTGQNGLNQARQFAEATEVTGVVLTKLDGSAKGGIVFADPDRAGHPGEARRRRGDHRRPHPLRPRRVRRGALRGVVRPTSFGLEPRAAPRRCATSRLRRLMLRSERAGVGAPTAAQVGLRPAGRIAGRMFEGLSDRFEGIFKRLRGKGRLSDADVDEVLREIRVALLEADVNVGVVRTVVGRIREACIGAELSKSLTPSQQVVKIVNAELTQALGGETLKITYAPRPPTVVLMAGLQGSGKTTNIGQAGPLVQGAGSQPAPGRGRPPAPGRRRAAAHARPPDRRAGVLRARRPGRAPPVAASTRPAASGATSCIVDTAGRLAIDEEMMDQVRRISDADRAELHVPRHRRHDRPGRRHHGRGLPPDPRARRRHPVQARRRRPRRRGAVGEGGHRPADRLRVDRREARRLRAVPPRPHGQPHPGHGRRAHPHREGRAGLREGPGRGGRRPAHGGRVHLRRLPRPDAAAEEDGPALERSSGCSPACRRSSSRPRSTTTS